MSISNDITIASYPKAGVTYLGYLLTSARAQENKLSIQPNFFNIDWLLVDAGQMRDMQRASIWRDGMGDFVKTHADRSPGRHNVVYLLRNPFDTLRSYYHFLRQWGTSPRDPLGTPRQFLDHPKRGVNAWLRHLQSWVLGQDPAQPILVVQYEDLVARPAIELNELLSGLGFYEYPEEVIEQAVDWATLSNMRQLERDFSERNPGYQQFNMEFIRPGEYRKIDEFEAHRDYVTQQTARVYEAVIAKLS